MLYLRCQLLTIFIRSNMKYHFKPPSPIERISAISWILAIHKTNFFLFLEEIYYKQCRTFGRNLLHLQHET